MIGNQELKNMIAQVEKMGAVVTVTFEFDALTFEGREIIETVQVSGLRGVGPYPMSPIAAAERFSEILAK